MVTRCVPRLALLASLCCSCLAQDDGASEVCPAGGGCQAAGASAGSVRQQAYHFPNARGWPMMGNSPHRFGGWPCDLEAKLAWSWVPPEGRYSNTGVQSPVIDGDKNLYVVVENSARKFSPDGHILWTFSLPPAWKKGTEGPWFRRMPSLAGGLVVTSMTSGFAVALSMDTGELVWNVSVTEQGCIGFDFGFVVAGEGVVLGDAECAQPEFYKNNKVYALNATDGSFLWDFHPDVGVWNFLPHFLGDGTVAFQTWDGGVYRLRLRDGSVLWHAVGGGKDSWTDGGPALGPNGVFYAVRSTSALGGSAFGHPGFLEAYNVTNGKLLWSNAFERAPYSYPAVGYLREGGPLTVALSVGSLGGLPVKALVVLGSALGAFMGLALGLLWWACAACVGCGCCAKRPACRSLLLGALLGAVLTTCSALAFMPHNFDHSVQAFDAQTGELLWRYDLPNWKWWCAAGDEEGLLTRIRGNHIPVCLPLASSYPTIDAQGIFYMGHMDGRLYAIQDRNGDGRIDEDSEVCSFRAGSAFSTQGPSLVPGLMAAGSCDTLYVFKQ